MASGLCGGKRGFEMDFFHICHNLKDVLVCLSPIALLVIDARLCQIIRELKKWR